MDLRADFPYSDLYPNDYVKYRFWHKVTAEEYRYMYNRSFRCDTTPTALIKGLKLERVEPIARSETASSLWVAWQTGEGLIYLQVTQVADNRVFFFMVASQTKPQLEKLWQKIVDRMPEPEDAMAEEVRMSFTNQSPGGGVQSYARKITAPQWSEIKDNYPLVVKTKVEELQLIKPSFSEAGGRLILFHGPPGGGKTTAIRSLCRTWMEWCRPVYVVDPEAFFGNSAYMMNLLLSDPDSTFDEDDLEEIWLNEEEDGIDIAIRQQAEKRAQSWRLLIAEDADDFLGTDARDRAGQALSRLLNVADGMVGQGLNLMLLITTNKDMEALHPAVKRAGRCRANIHFSNFSSVAATEWLAARGVTEKLKGPGDYPLATLFEKLTESEKQITADREAVLMGQYL